ncbi:hypothetical protein CEXT_676471 [Caerostris extrusa]|uniref:Uncharacterized protein n=1 Tax=Caerostris extrusa TaxID=172846 RepID=A0AAV4Y4Z7_CAEEX|nr:hypothetical protein CEXT_676471 [Caerostris extrusa]
MWTHYLLIQTYPSDPNGISIDMYRNHIKYSFDGCQKHLNSKTGNGSRIMICQLTRDIMPERSFPTKQLNTSETETKILPRSSLCECMEHLLRKMSKCTGKKCDLCGHQSEKCYG